MALTKDDIQAIGALLDSKLDSKLEPISKRLNSLEENQQTMQNSIQKLEENQLKLEKNQLKLEENQQTMQNSLLRIELEQYPRIAAALDGVIAGIDRNKEQDSRILALEQKVDNCDTRLYLVESAIKKAL